MILEIFEIVPEEKMRSEVLIYSGLVDIKHGCFKTRFKTVLNRVISNKNHVELSLRICTDL